MVVRKLFPRELGPVTEVWWRSLDESTSWLRPTALQSRSAHSHPRLVSMLGFWSYCSHLQSFPLSAWQNLNRVHRFDGPLRSLTYLRSATLVGAALLASSPAPAEDWSLEIVDDLAVQTTSMAMEDSGRRHISYYDLFPTRLKYAFYDGSNWPIEVDDDTFDSGEYSSIAVDAGGNPHISYYGDYQDGGLKYAVRNAASSTWSVEIVDQGRPQGEYTSLALDGSGNPRVSYRSIGTGTSHLWFASFDGSWTIEQVESGTRPTDTSLVLDESGNPLIAYRVSASGRMWPPVKTFSMRSTTGQLDH